MEFVSECFQPYNGLFTVFVLTCACYWILVVAGFLGVEVLDMEVDVDADLDGAVDGGADAWDVGSVGLIRGFARLMHFHEVPLMVVLTIWSTIMWLMFCTLNMYWNTEESWTFALIWVLPTFMASIAISKVALIPFVALFRRVNIPEKKLGDYVGEECMVQTSEVTEKFGQAEISTDQSPLVVQVRNKTRFHFSSGDIAILEKYNQTGKFFEIRPLERKPELPEGS